MYFMASVATSVPDPTHHAPDTRSQNAELESFVYNDSIVRLFSTATIVWGLVAFVAGLYVALQLVIPQLSFGIEFLTTGRLRPLHTNAAIFAFAGTPSSLRFTIRLSGSAKLACGATPWD